MNFELSALYVWKNTVSLGYPCLESFLSTIDMVDSALICVDPTSDNETLKLCNSLQDKFPEKVRAIVFKWPKTSLDGSAIGTATQYALAQVRTEYAVNIQADECWPTQLMAWTRDYWKQGAVKGLECLHYKVLHTEFNAQQFQGGEEWDGVKYVIDRNGNRRYTDVWSRGGMINAERTKGGAGYSASVKLFKKCPAITISHDGWSVEGCATMYHCDVSDEFPIIHLHDFFRDHYIDIRKNAGYSLWTDQQKYGYYRADADRIEATKAEWISDPKWTETTSPFDSLLPEFVKPLIGNTSYRVRYELLDRF